MNNYKRIGNLNSFDTLAICKRNAICETCRLYFRGWCIHRNSYNQLRIHLSKMEFENYINKFVKVGK